jgi:hypothetical protein
MHFHLLVVREDPVQQSHCCTGFASWQESPIITIHHLRLTCSLLLAAAVCADGGGHRAIQGEPAHHTPSCATRHSYVDCSHAQHQHTCSATCTAERGSMQCCTGVTDQEVCACIHTSHVSSPAIIMIWLLAPSLVKAFRSSSTLAGKQAQTHDPCNASCFCCCCCAAVHEAAGAV